MSARKNAQATWGGRFSAGPAELMLRFGESVSFDHRLWAQDIRGSKAHATMLAQAGILTKKERDAILRGLDAIAKEIAAGKFAWSRDLEDVHMNIESALTKRVPAAADRGFTAVKHQREVGTGYFDAVTTPIEANASTPALKGSTEDEQFFDKKHG